MFVCVCIYVCLEAEKFVSESLGRLTMQTDAVKAVSDADLVIEAIVENLETKQRLFAALDRAAPRFLITLL